MSSGEETDSNRVMMVPCMFQPLKERLERCSSGSIKRLLIRCCDTPSCKGALSPIHMKCWPTLVTVVPVFETLAEYKFNW